ncbi:MAG: hypothetical protein II896_03825 [Clostridia bacterium]|nr:hypothetical protein [Clostridia bacterium]
MDEACKTSGKPYTVSISAGYARCENAKLSLSSYIDQADEMLYKNKRISHDGAEQRRAS